jgi:integrase
MEATMSVKRARSGVGYEARWRERGRARQATFRTKREAEQAERLGTDRERGRRNGLPADRGPITYDDLCDRFLAQYQFRARSKRTVEERLAYSRRTFGSLPVREILPESVAAWNAALPVMRKQALGAMRQALNAAVAWGYLPSSPAAPDLIRAPGSEPTKVSPFESWAQIDDLADAAATDAALVRFGCATGLRPQEWQVLRWTDLDVANRGCRVQRTLSDGSEMALGKASGSLRTVVLQRRALDALAMLPRPIDRHQLVFTSPAGGIIDLGNFRRRVWHPALDAAGLEQRPPGQMRHTFATLGLAAGAPLEWISKQLGHSGTRITMRHYARFLPATNERALRALDAFERAPNAHTLSVNGSDEA